MASDLLVIVKFRVSSHLNLTNHDKSSCEICDTVTLWTVTFLLGCWRNPDALGALLDCGTAHGTGKKQAFSWKAETSQNVLDFPGWIPHTKDTPVNLPPGCLSVLRSLAQHCLILVVLEAWFCLESSNLGWTVTLLVCGLFKRCCSRCSSSNLYCCIWLLFHKIVIKCFIWHNIVRAIETVSHVFSCQG